MTTETRAAATAGVDAAALKPTEHDLTAALELPPAVGGVVVDYEGREAFPDPDLLARLARDRTVRVTTPVRADGFDPLGDDAVDRRLPSSVERVLVAGHGAYLDDEEASRAIAPRLGAARERHPGAWVGTEGVERLALATGGPQFELLDPRSAREARALRAAGFEATLAVYAPVVLSVDDDEVLDAVGAYAARRSRVASRLPEGAPVDARATGRAREVLLEGCREHALVGSRPEVRERAGALREAGFDRVVGYPARGPSELS